MGIYEIMDWIDKVSGFTWEEMCTFADSAKIKISDSKIRRESTLRSLLEALVNGAYLIQTNEKLFIVKRYIKKRDLIN
jgi:hypothetical protein